MPVVVAAPQSGVRFKLFSYASARFTFRGRTKNERAVLHGVVADAPYGAFIEPRRRIALPVGAHQAVLTQRIGDQLYSAKAAFTITAAGENEIEVTFEQTHGLRVKVIDQANTPLGGVTVFASLRPANTDQFPEAERVVVSRPITNNVALGSGRNSCVGAQLIRMAASVATRGLLARFGSVELCGVADWRTGSGFCFPSSVVVRLTSY